MQIIRVVRAFYMSGKLHKERDLKIIVDGLREEANEYEIKDAILTAAAAALTAQGVKEFMLKEIFL